MAARGALALAALLAACGGDGDSGAELGQVSGTVRDEQSGERLSGVEVVFTSDTLDRQEGKTGHDGGYRLHVASRVPNGRIAASKKGYATRVVSVYLDTSDVHIDVDLARGH
jgi:hypothetical protein